MSKYIKVDDLQRYCDNQKDHSITPNEFQRMMHYDFGWHTGTPTEEGWYVLECNIGNSDGTYYATDYWDNEVGYWTVNRVIRWQKIEED